MRFLHATPRSMWLSAAGGISVAYVFVHILPEFEHHQHEFDLRGGPLGLLDASERHVYFVALVGLVAFEKIVSGRNPNAWVSGIKIAWDSTRAAGSRITLLQLADGRPFDDAATYTVVINDFMLTGGSGLGFPTQPISSEPINVVDLDALVAYLKSLPQPVTVRPETRISPPPAASQARP